MTHLLKSLLNGNLLALVAFTAALTPQALKAAHADGQCPLQNATLRGTYMSSGTGTIVGVGPASAVGTITYDGKGNSVNTFTVSVERRDLQGSHGDRPLHREPRLHWDPRPIRRNPLRSGGRTGWEYGLLD
jgi:hypothetical protein